MTFQYRLKPLAPMVFAARTNRGFIFFMPDSMAMETAKVEPTVITKIIALSFNPNQRIEKGSQHILGRVCNPKIKGLKFSSRYLKRTMAKPTIIPIMMDNK